MVSINFLQIFLNFQKIKCDGLQSSFLNEIQKQPPRGALEKMYSENIQQIYRRAPTPKCKATLLKSHFGMGVLL